jgi:hypothetical protein
VKLIYQVVRELALFPLVVPVVAYVGAFSFGPQHATKDFFVVAAQIIPLLIVAIALEARLLAVNLPSTEGLRADIEEARTSLAKLDYELTHLTVQATEPDTEQTKRLADQRQVTSRQLKCLQQTRRDFRVHAIRVRLYAGQTAVFLLIGEVTALDTLAKGSYEQANARWAFAAIVLGLVAIIFAAFRHAPPTS